MTFLEKFTLAARWSYPRLGPQAAHAWDKLKDAWGNVTWYMDDALDGLRAFLWALLYLVLMPVILVLGAIGYIFNPLICALTVRDPARWELTKKSLEERKKSHEQKDHS